jgi:hypothetical protein
LKRLRLLKPPLFVGNVRGAHSACDLAVDALAPSTPESILQILQEIQALRGVSLAASCLRRGLGWELGLVGRCRRFS